MNPDALIESYVRDVVMSLPRRQRSDVASELRLLLAEELQGRAVAAGRDADSAMALELLAAFGRPPEVADRYRPAGFTIIRPSDAPRFAWVGLGGVALQWVLSLIATYTAPADSALPGADWLSRLGGWWLSWGLGSFWWPGFLVTFTMIAAAIGARHGGSEEWSPARALALDRDRVRRPLMALVLALGVVGASLVLAVPTLASWAPDLPRPLLDAFAMDPGFLAWRAPWVLVLWAASFALGIAVLVAGRWSVLTRRLAIVLDLLWIALLLLWATAGPIFLTESADGSTRLLLLLLAAALVLDVALRIRRTVAGSGVRLREKA